MLAAPVVSRGVVVAALLFITCGRRPAFTEDDRALVVELAARASAAVEQAERFQQTRQVSLALQSAMLSAPPRHPRRGGAGPVPAGGGRPGGRAATGTTRSRCPAATSRSASATSPGTTCRRPRRWASCAACCGRWPTRPSGAPSDVRAAGWTGSRPGWTSPASPRCVFGRVCRRGDATRVPLGQRRPPAAGAGAAGRGAGAAARRRGGGAGVAPERPRVDCEVELAAGSTLLLYTDGLVERRNDPDDTRVRATCSTSSAAARSWRCPTCASTSSAARPPTPATTWSSSRCGCRLSASCELASS